MRAVSNTGPLIHLSWIDRLDLLRQLFDEFLVPEAVYAEAVEAMPEAKGATAIQAMFSEGWVQVRSVADPGSIDTLLQVLDRGEAEAIVLARQEAADILLSDDRRARVAASRQGLAFVGTLGLLKLAHGRGLVGPISPMLVELRRQGFWLSAELLDRVRRDEELG